MNSFSRIIKTDSYFNIFNILQEEVKNLPNGIDNNTLIFCEEKISLLAENAICSTINGSFSTRVYSFGNYLRQKLKIEGVLSKEGSAMALRRILKTIPLKCFNKSRQNLSSSIVNLIALLKSAKVTSQDLMRAREETSGVLKNKLEDIYTIFDEYERFISLNNYDDQSSVLSYLPQIFLDDEKIKNTDIILFGYTSWTKQIISIIDTLMKCAKSITVITTEGDNKFAYVNEIDSIYAKICADNNITLIREKDQSPYIEEAKLICENIFNPTSFKFNKLDSDRIVCISAQNEYKQIERVAEIIKEKVILGASYSDFTIACSDGEKLEYGISKVFSKLEIPYFLDIKKKGKNTALVALILSYIEIFRRGFDRDDIIDFIKNPLFNLEKDLALQIENYIIRYNINYKRFLEPFTLAEMGEPLEEFNRVREKLVSIFSTFSIEKMLEDLSIKEREQELSILLRQNGYINESAINDQVYDACINILQEMHLLLGGNASLLDIKETFISGINALELSIIPQYKDAVFIGDFRGASLLQNKYVFVLNLTADVPTIKEDIAILSDSDLDALDGLKMVIEPKIRIVNHREREHIAMALSCFTNNLFYCSPSCSGNGKKNIRSEIVDYLENMFTVKKYSHYNNYLTYKQGLENFSKDCTMYADGRKTEFSSACDFYEANKDDDGVKKILEEANSEIVKDITVNRSLAVGVSSPTALESYSACPYKAFLELYLRVKDRESGEVDSLSTGILIHEVFEKFIKRIDEVNSKESCEEIAIEIFNKILERDEFKKFLFSNKESATIDRIKNEIIEYCYKLYSSFNTSLFKPKYIEKKFGDGENNLPPIKLLGGKIKLKGKIDRVDEYKDYIRIIDYKTGNIYTKKEELFTGNKLQLYLYGKVFSDKKIAGAYYMPISSSYKSLDKKQEPMLFGDTLNDSDIVLAQDSKIKDDNGNLIATTIKDGDVKKAVSEDMINAFTEYAFKISEKIVERLDEGYIPASPLKETCSHCKFSGICGDRICDSRDTLKVDDATIAESVKGEN